MRKRILTRDFHIGTQTGDRSCLPQSGSTDFVSSLFVLCARYIYSKGVFLPVLKQQAPKFEEKQFGRVIGKVLRIVQHTAHWERRKSDTEDWLIKLQKSTVT